MIYKIYYKPSGHVRVTKAYLKTLSSYEKASLKLYGYCSTKINEPNQCFIIDTNFIDKYDKSYFYKLKNDVIRNIRNKKINELI